MLCEKINIISEDLSLLKVILLQLYERDTALRLVVRRLASTATKETL